MQFGRHISKGFWALADKGMLALYGVAFMLIVIRTLPPEEYGTLVLFQTVFLLITSLATSFAIQPMVKYVAEGSDARASGSTTLVITALLIAVCTGIVLLLSHPIATLLAKAYSPQLAELLLWLPVLLAANIYKMVISGLLQARLQVRQLFAVDSVYFVTSLALILLAYLSGSLTHAEIVIYIMIISSLLSSGTALLLTRAVTIPAWRWDASEAGKIFDYGKYTLGGTIGNIVQTQFDTLLISTFSGVGGAAVYYAAKNFTRIFDMFTQSMQMLIVPASSILQARGDKEGLIALVEKSICFGLLAIIPVVAIFMLFPGTLVSLIYGNKYPESIPVLRILALTGLVIPWGVVIASVLMGTGRTAVGFLMSIVSLVFSLVIYYVSGSIAGLTGIVWGVVCMYAILGLLGTLILHHYVPFRMMSIVRRTKDAIQFARTWKQLFKPI
jgi:O-antigen/teichoic acid export membrane protein